MDCPWEDTEAVQAALAEAKARRTAMPDAEQSAYYMRQAKILWRFGLKPETPYESPVADWKRRKEREAANAKLTNRVVCGFDVKAGALLMATEPFAVFVPPGSASTTCARCLSQFATAKRCARCKRTCYCDAACQRADWRVHREECETLPALLDILDGDEDEYADCALATRCFRKMELRDAEDDLDETASIRVDVRGCLAAHEVLADAARSRAHRLASAVLETRVLAATKQWTEARRSDIVELLVLGRAAFVDVADDAGRVVARAFYPHFALLEHSCAPSVVPTYAKLASCSPARASAGRIAEQRWHASRPLRVGEFAARAYAGVDLALDHLGRREQLLERYGTVCDCARCAAEKDPGAAEAAAARNDERERTEAREDEAARLAAVDAEKNWLADMDARYADAPKPAAPPTRSVRTANVAAAIRAAERAAAPRSAPKVRRAARRAPDDSDDDDTISGLP